MSCREMITLPWQWHQNLVVFKQHAQFMIVCFQTQKMIFTNVVDAR